MSEAFDKAIKHSINLGYGNLWYYDSADYARLLAAFNEARDQLGYANAGAMCPACLGSPISGKPCICGGSNDAHDAYSGCLRQLLKTESDLAAAREEISKLSTRIDSLLASETEAVEQLARIREVLTEYCESCTLCYSPDNHWECPICIKADALLAPKPLAVEKESKG